MDKNWKPVPQQIRYYLTEEEQDYMRRHFPQYHFDFPKSGGKPRAHCLAALARNQLEKQIMYRKSNKKIVDFGGAFHRHFFEGRTNVYTVMFKGNIEDQRRSRERIADMQAHDKEAADLYLKEYVCFVDSNTQRAFPEIKFDEGLMIHALYNNTPSDIATIMSLYRINKMDCTLNYYTDDLEMYCRTLKWSRDDEGLYYQDDIQAGTSIYTHTQNPGYYSTLKQIVTASSIILVSTTEKCGDQVIISFERFDKSQVTSGFDDKLAVVRKEMEEHITYPVYQGSYFGHPIATQVTKIFKPNRLALNRCIEVLQTKHYKEANVYQIAMEELLSLNHKTLLINGAISFKIQLSPDELREHALYAQHEHSKYLSVRSYYVATPRSNTPWHQMSYGRQLATIFYSHVNKWFTLDPIKNNNNDRYNTNPLPYFSVTQQQIHKVTHNVTIDSSDTLEPTPPEHKVQAFSPPPPSLSLNIHRPSKIITRMPKFSTPFAIQQHKCNQIIVLHKILKCREQILAAEKIQRFFRRQSLANKMLATAAEHQSESTEFLNILQRKFLDFPAVFRPSRKFLFRCLLSQEPPNQPLTISHDMWVTIMFARRRLQLRQHFFDPEEFEANLPDIQAQFARFMIGDN